MSAITEDRDSAVCTIADAIRAAVPVGLLDQLDAAHRGRRAGGRPARSRHRTTHPNASVN